MLGSGQAQSSSMVLGLALFLAVRWLRSPTSRVKLGVLDDMSGPYAENPDKAMCSPPEWAIRISAAPCSASRSN